MNPARPLGLIACRALVSKTHFPSSGGEVCPFPTLPRHTTSVSTSRAETDLLDLSVFVFSVSFSAAFVETESVPCSVASKEEVQNR